MGVVRRYPGISLVKKKLRTAEIYLLHIGCGVMGVLAAYGLRPHELFFCEISPEHPHLLKVLKGKTGYREVYPIISNGLKNGSYGNRYDSFNAFTFNLNMFWTPIKVISYLC